MIRLVGLAVFYVTGTWGRMQTEGFMLSNILSSMPYDVRWAPTDTQIALPSVFSEPVYYLASGGQCYAFSSSDDKYVIKFFKHRKKQKKLERDFTSYALANKYLKEETGLVCIHLNKTTHINKTLCLVDKLGIKHTISLDNCEFIIQKKASLVVPYLQNLISHGELNKACDALDALISLMIQRSQKGIYDEDSRVHRNCGFLNETPKIIDIGRLCENKEKTAPYLYKKDITSSMHKLSTWLKETSPPLYEHLNEKLSQL